MTASLYRKLDTALRGIPVPGLELDIILKELRRSQVSRYLPVSSRSGLMLGVRASNPGPGPNIAQSHKHRSRWHRYGYQSPFSSAMMGVEAVVSIISPGPCTSQYFSQLHIYPWTETQLQSTRRQRRN